LDDLGLNSLEQLPELEAAGASPAQALSEAAGLQGVLIEDVAAEPGESSIEEVAGEAVMPPAVQESGEGLELIEAPATEIPLQPEAVALCFSPDPADAESLTAPISAEGGASPPAQPDPLSDAAEQVQTDA